MQRKMKHGLFNKSIAINHSTEKELEHENNHSIIKGNKPMEKIIFPENLAPSPELIAKAQKIRVKENGYYKSRDLYGCVDYQDDEKPTLTGCQLYWIGDDSCIPNHPYDDAAYIFIDQTDKNKILLYGKNGEFEKVTINDMSKFIELFSTMMDTEECKYYFKHINYDEIHALITLNGGHIPNKAAANLEKNQAEAKNKFNY